MPKAPKPKEPKPQEEPKSQESKIPMLIIYLDYNGVLNAWPTVEAAAEFLQALQALYPVVKLRIATYCPHRRIKKTMKELEQAKLSRFFDEIVFTAQRVGFDDKVYWDAGQERPTPKEDEGFRVICFEGGKNQYIRNAYWRDWQWGWNPVAIIFVDDKENNVDAVRRLSGHRLWQPWTVVALQARRSRRDEYHELLKRIS